ncbi:dockerin type I repeat-containing protein [Patescibacteria group bacterium]
MFRFLIKLNLVIFFLSILFIIVSIKEVQALTKVSDLLSSSAPGIASNHTIKFFTMRNIPPEGKIIITPESGFFVSVGFNYADIDFATSSSLNGPYTDRFLTGSFDPNEDDISVVANSFNGSITITLNDSFGIATNTYVQIELGENATFGVAGNRQIINPAIVDSYGIDIDIYDQFNNLVDRSKPMVAIIEPVTMSAELVKQRLNGTPIGFLTFGTTQTILSMETNFAATCRHSTTASTSYALMTGNFTTTGTTTATVFHQVMLTGLSNGGDYVYYIRCEDAVGTYDDVTDCIYNTATSTIETTCVDYVVSFGVSAQEGEEGEEQGENPGPGGGGRGGGSGGGSGGGAGAGSGEKEPFPPPPEGPGVILEGWAYPLGEVFVLKDGQSEGAIRANQQAEFSFFSEEYDQGVYTFSIWGKDLDGRTSNTYSTTFWIDEGTQTTVSDIFLSPTIQLSSSAVNPGEIIEVMGQSVPNSTVEVWLFPNKRTAITDEEIIKQFRLVGNDGRWGALYNTDNIQEGNYKIKARSNLVTIGNSGFSKALDCAIGTAYLEGECSGADLNGDGRVNLTDFSILLYYWETNDSCADQNKDGTVNLIDFSIMMYYWTG